MNPETCTALAHSPTGSTIGGESSLEPLIGNRWLMFGPPSWPLTCELISMSAATRKICINLQCIIEYPSPNIAPVPQRKWVEFEGRISTHKPSNNQEQTPLTADWHSLPLWPRALAISRD